MGIDLTLPELHTEGIQQGLRDVAGAVDYQRQLQNQRDAAKATLAVSAAFNDKINELKNSSDFSQDWGEKLRQDGAQILDSQAQTFHDPAAFAQFRDAQAMHYESVVPDLRDKQKVASEQHDQATIEAVTENAKEMAPTDLGRAANTLNTIYGANIAVDQATGAKSVGFGAVALNAARGNGAVALKAYQASVDGVAGTYVDAKVDQITRGDATPGAKLDALTDLKKSVWQDIESNNLHVSAASRALIDDNLAKQLAAAKNKVSSTGEQSASVTISDFNAAAAEQFQTQVIGDKKTMVAIGRAYPASASINIGGDVFTNAKNDNPARKALDALTKPEFHPEILGDDRVNLATKLEAAAERYDQIKRGFWGDGMDKALKAQVADVKARWAFLPVSTKSAELAELRKKSPLVAAELVDDAKLDPVQAPALKSMVDLGTTKLKDVDPGIKQVFSDAVNQAMTGYAQEVQTDPNKALTNAQGRIKTALEECQRSSVDGVVARMVGIRTPQDLAGAAQDQKIVSDLFRVTAAGAALKDSVYADFAQSVMANKAQLIAASLKTRVDAIGPASWSDKDGYVFQATSMVGIPGKPGSALRTYRFNGDGNGVVSLDVMENGKWTQAVANIDKPLDKTPLPVYSPAASDNSGYRRAYSYWKTQMNGVMPKGKTEVNDETTPGGMTFGQWIQSDQAKRIMGSK